MKPVLVTAFHAARAALAIAGLIATGAGCDESISRGWLVDRPRLLAARVEATADPNRASIAPSEPARITWLFSAPTAVPRVSWAFASCLPPDGNFALPRCNGPAIASGSGVSDGSERIPMDYAAPNAAAIGDAKELLVLAAFCESGTPQLDPRSFTATCESGNALLASATVRLAAAGPNANPSIADDAVLLDDTVIAPSTTPAGPSGSPCQGAPSAPVVAPGAERTFKFRFRGDEREPITTSTGGASVESIILSHAVTAGELDRQYSSFDPEDAAPKVVEIPWTAPGDGEVAAEGRLVEIHFVLRDGRGGAAFTRRTVCVRR